MKSHVALRGRIDSRCEEGARLHAVRCQSVELDARRRAAHMRHALRDRCDLPELIQPIIEDVLLFLCEIAGVIHLQMTEAVAAAALAQAGEQERAETAGAQQRAN